jgi:RNA:NAD 2'-phosphotransferase (TPT1/KptA family)
LAVLLEVQAAAAHANGVSFYMANDIVWLATFIPSEFVSQAGRRFKERISQMVGEDG